MLTVDKTKKMSKKDVQKCVNQKLTRGGIYLLDKKTKCKGLLINLKQTTEITNRSISIFS